MKSFWRAVWRIVFGPFRFLLRWESRRVAARRLRSENHTIRRQQEEIEAKQHTIKHLESVIDHQRADIENLALRLAKDDAYVRMWIAHYARAETNAKELPEYDPKQHPYQGYRGPA